MKILNLMIRIRLIYIISSKSFELKMITASNWKQSEHQFILFALLWITV